MPIREELERFPSVRTAWDHCGPTEGQARHLRMLLDAEHDGFSAGLPEIDAALAELFAKRTPSEFDEQVRALFGSEAQWEKANTELLALSFFSGRDELESTGWPRHGYGDTPPFDGRAIVHDTPIPFDVKSARGSTFRWLKDALEPELSRWMPAADLTLSVRSRGVYARQIVSPHRRAFVDQLRVALTHRSLADLPITVTLEAGVVTIDATIEPASETVTVNSHVGSPAHRANAVAGTILEHIEDKSQLAVQTGAPAFFLVYVRPHSSGSSDFTPTVFDDLREPLLEAVVDIPGNERWLGALFLDWTPTPFGIHVVSNRPAVWPGGLGDTAFERWALSL